MGDYRFGQGALLLPPRQEDINDAIWFLEETSDGPIDRSRLRLVEVVWMDPWDFIDQPSLLGKKSDRGWLLKEPEDDWLKELHGTYSRDFSHILNYWIRRAVPPGIQIDEMMGDGRGRASFHFAVDEMLPVAVFRSK